jgi:hypothetical protein
MSRFNRSVSKVWRSVAVALSVSVTLVVIGCSGDDSGLARRYQVTGKVTYKGAPVPKGRVNFVPTKPAPPEGRAASGDIQSDGTYSLTTAGDNDGALPGDYKVEVVSLDIDLKSAAANPEGIIHQGDPAHQKAIKGGKSLIPTKYNLGDTSGLKATVTAGGANQFNFELND